MRNQLRNQSSHAAAWTIAALALAFLAAVQWSHARTAQSRGSQVSRPAVEVVTPDRPDRHEFDGLTADVEGVGEVSTRLYHGPVVPRHRAIDVGP